MPTRVLLAVSEAQVLRFCFERLRDVSGDNDAAQGELLYNAGMLAHFATTSTTSADVFPATSASLSTVFDLFVLDRSHHTDPELAEAAAAQRLLLTGFFQDQLRQRQHRLATEQRDEPRLLHTIVPQPPGIM